MEAQMWASEAEEAVATIQDTTVDYFKETVKALTGDNAILRYTQL